MRVLKRVPNSVMWFYFNYPEGPENLKREAIRELSCDHSKIAKPRESLTKSGLIKSKKDKLGKSMKIKIKYTNQLLVPLTFIP